MQFIHYSLKHLNIMNLTKNKKGKTLLMKKITIAFIFFLPLLFISSCKNDSSKAHLSVNMTDAPGNYDAVKVDIQSIEITGSTGNTVVLNAKSGIYNLLDFSNGLDTLIATGDIDAVTVSQIRLILGPNNTVMIGGVVYPLSTPSAMQSGLKLEINKTFEAGVSYSILLDFDANKSIVLTGNGVYQLKPVIRTIDTAISGSIKGNLSLALKNVVITTKSADAITYTTTTNENGAFIFAGLPEGTYDVTVTPALPLLPVTITGLVVAVGLTTYTGIIAL